MRAVVVVSRQAGFRIVSLFVGSLAALMLVEATLRIVGLGYGNSPVDSDPILHHKHPLDYDFVSFTPSGEYAGHHVRYDTSGLVSDPDAEAEPDGRAPYSLVAFLGDSFVEALQVPYSSSFVGLLNRNSKDGILVKNFGVTSYSPMLYLLQWDQVVREFAPGHVFLLLYSNDIRGDAELARSIGWGGVGEPPGVPGPQGGRLVTRLRASYLARLLRRAQLTARWLLTNRASENAIVGGFVEENPDISSLSSQLVLSLARKVEAAGAEFILMAVPSKEKLVGTSSDSGREFSDKWKQWAFARGITFVDLVPAFTEADDPFFELDIHFNESGHRIAAKTIASAYPELFLPIGQQWEHSDR